MSKNSREKILDAALRTLAQNPLSTMDAIAEAAGVGRATLFRHFPAKKTLMRALAFEATRRCAQALEPVLRSELPPLEKLERAVEAYIPLGAAFHFLTFEPWHTDDAALEQDYKTHLARWEALLHEVRQAGHIAPDISLYWAVTSLDMLLYGASEGIFAGEVAPKQAARLVLRSYLKGVGPGDAAT